MAKTITRTSGAGIQRRGTPPNASFANVQLPKGYAVATSFGVNWDYLKPPHTLVGKVDGAGVRVVEAPDPNNKGKLRHVHKVSIINEDGEILDVWESASLKDWFSRITPGAQVAVAYQGERPSRPGRSPMKMFAGGFAGELPPVNPDYVDYGNSDDEAHSTTLRRAGPPAKKAGPKRR